MSEEKLTITATVVFSQTLNDLYNKCSANIRRAFNKQDGLIVSDRVRSLIVSDQFNGSVLSGEFGPVESEAVATLNSAGTYNISIMSYIPASLQTPAKSFLPALTIPTHTVIEDGVVPRDMKGLTREGAIEKLKNFGADMVNSGEFKYADDQPRKAINYRQL